MEICQWKISITFPLMSQFIIKHTDFNTWYWVHTCLDPWKPGFNPRWLQVRFAVDELTLEQVFLGVLRFSLTNHDFTSAPYTPTTSQRGVSQTWLDILGPKFRASDPTLWESQNKSIIISITNRIVNREKVCIEIGYIYIVYRIFLLVQRFL
jgi:hypothetical protein